MPTESELYRREVPCRCVHRGSGNQETTSRQRGKTPGNQMRLDDLVVSYCALKNGEPKKVWEVRTDPNAASLSLAEKEEIVNIGRAGAANQTDSGRESGASSPQLSPLI